MIDAGTGGNEMNYVFRVAVACKAISWSTEYISARTMVEAIKKAERLAKQDGAERPHVAEIECLGELR